MRKAAEIIWRRHSEGFEDPRSENPDLGHPAPGYLRRVFW